MEKQGIFCYNKQIVFQLTKTKTDTGKKMKIKNKILATILLVILLTPSLVLAASVKDTLPLPSSDNYAGIIDPPAENMSGKDQVVALGEGLIQNFKLIAGIIAIGVILILAIRIIIARGQEDEIKKYLQGMMWAIVALALIGLSGDLAKILGPQQGGLIKEPNQILTRVQLFDFKVNIIITFTKYILGAVAIAYLVRVGMRLIAASDNEENVTQDKKNLGAVAVGLLLIYLGDVAINKVLYKIDKTTYPGVEGVQPGLDPDSGIAEVVGFTNFIVTLISPMVVAVLVAGGIIYVTSAGNEERMDRAKRMIFSAIIGLIIIYGAFAIVNTFIPEQVIAEVA